jgi:hypothetical protein
MYKLIELYILLFYHLLLFHFHSSHPTPPSPITTPNLSNSNSHHRDTLVATGGNNNRTISTLGQGYGGSSYGGFQSLQVRNVVVVCSVMFVVL